MEQGVACDLSLGACPLSGLLTTDYRLLTMKYVYKLQALRSLQIGCSLRAHQTI